MKTLLILKVCIEIFTVSLMFLRRIIQESSGKQQWNINVSETSTFKRLMIISVCRETINVSFMFHRCRIVVSLMNRLVFLMATLRNHQCYHFVLDWGSSVFASKNQKKSKANIAKLQFSITTYFRTFNWIRRDGPELAVSAGSLTSFIFCTRQLKFINRSS